MVKTKNLTLMVTAAVLAALTCVATMVVQIPMPLTKGYVNLGDVMVLTSVWLIGSPWGVAAAGIGSAMADLLTGYAYYAPATLIIKALMAVAAFYIAKCFMNGSYFKSLVGKVIGGAVAEIIMVAGYFVYAIILYGNSGGRHFRKRNTGRCRAYSRCASDSCARKSRNEEIARF